MCRDVICYAYNTCLHTFGTASAYNDFFFILVHNRPETVLEKKSSIQPELNSGPSDFLVRHSYLLDPGGSRV